MPSYAWHTDQTTVTRSHSEQHRQDCQPYSAKRDEGVGFGRRPFFDFWAPPKKTRPAQSDASRVPLSQWADPVAEAFCRDYHRLRFNPRLESVFLGKTCLSTASGAHSHNNRRAG